MLAQANAWLSYQFSAEGVEGWSDKAATNTGYISLLGVGVTLVGHGVTLVSCAETAGAGCAVGESIALFGVGITGTFGLISTGFSGVNSAANFALGNNSKAMASGGAVAIGVATAGAGAGGVAIAKQSGRETMPYINNFILDVGGFFAGAGITSDS